MSAFKVLLVHVGNMNNKGTQALLKSDVLVIKSFLNEVSFSVSTTDVEGVGKLGLFERVFPPFVDIPYERADFHARKMGFSRDSLRYKATAIASLFLMFIQLWLSAMSAVLAKFGFKTFYRADLLEGIKSADLIVSYSDENFKEGASFLPSNVYWILSWWSMLFSRAWIVLAAKFLGKSVIMFPNSVGGFKTWVGRLVAKAALNMFDFVLVREPISLRTVKSIGVRSPVSMAADTTLLLNFDGDEKGFGFHGSNLGVSLGVYSHTLSDKEIRLFVDVCSRVLDAAIEKYGFNVIFIPHYVSGFRRDDLEISELIYKRMKRKARARIVNPSSLEEYGLLLGSVDMVVSSKMHPAVLAMAAFVPALCVAYDDKQLGFFRQLGLSDCTLPVTNLSAKRFLEKIDHVWSSREQIRCELERRIPELRARLRYVLGRVLKSYVKDGCVN
ncbi:MAG: polysaccharide pyruvyl transferase family protein [Candidatus Freyarchaeota archaeon]